MWLAKPLAHSEDDAEERERRARRGERVSSRDMVERLCGGVLGRGVLDGTHVPGATDLAAWCLAFAATDRLRPAVPVASADTSHLYAIQTARAYKPHRTVDGALANRSGTSTTWVDTLEHPAMPLRAVRIAAYRAMREPCLPRLTRELHWRIFSDALPMGDGRCCKARDAELCTICVALGHGRGLSRHEQLESYRETARHVRLECPYTMAVIDPVARAIAAAIGWDMQTRARSSIVGLLREVGAAMVHGHRGVDEAGGPFAVMVCELSRVLVERQRFNASGVGAVDCSARACYRRWAVAVDALVRHSWRAALAEEAALPLWMAEVPQEDTPTARWLKEWGCFVRSRGNSYELGLPWSLEAVPGALAAMPPGQEVVAVSHLGVHGARVVLHLTVATRLPSEVRMGPLLTPEKVLCAGGAGGGARAAARRPVPPPAILRRGGGLPAVYVDGSGAGAGGWGVVVVTGSRGGADRDAREVASFLRSCSAGCRCAALSRGRACLEQCCRAIRLC